ncbi:lipoprotein [Spiroplasma alleghenense]|uniref:Lipoprotein n=1 Tax=Spiroplasma alleghenense TaxID=216931 RepID=A0A345Z2H4_9MOLU|nr:lipoprotein [Spiroplasma alleghenense]AXK50803.1 hypothetical protein SALLE_v1c01270 [Spiroplasma alleghenense]
MKKLLIALASIGLMATPVTTVVSCFGDTKNQRDYLDLWTADKYAQELSDLKYEVLENNDYRLTSEKFGLDFVIQENEGSGMKYEITNRSMRIDKLDINNYDKTTTIDGYAAFAATQDQLPEEEELDKINSDFSIKSTIKEAFCSIQIK